MSGLTRDKAEAAGDAFDDLVLSPFAYVLFLLHLREKRKAAEPLTSLELSVERRAAVLDLSWFPREAEAADHAATHPPPHAASSAHGGPRPQRGPKGTHERSGGDMAATMRTLLGMPDGH